MGRRLRSSLASVTPEPAVLSFCRTPDPGYKSSSPPRYGGSFTFPDFSEFQPVETVEAAARHWLDTATKYRICRVGFDSEDTSRVYTNVEIDDDGAPAALAIAFDDFAHHRLPNNLTTSWMAQISHPSARNGNSNASPWSSYSAKDGLPPCRGHVPPDSCQARPLTPDRAADR